MQGSGKQNLAAAPANEEEPSPHCVDQGKKAKRRDVGRLHTMRHGVLSRHPLDALRRLGEDVKALRRLEKRLWAALKPEGVVKQFIFDRFWSSHLRSLLAVRIEAMVIATLAQPADQPIGGPSLVERETPTLVYSEANDYRSLGGDHFALALENLSLIQRYDAHVCKEEFRALALLLASLGDGEKRLAQAVAQLLGINRAGSED